MTIHSFGSYFCQIRSQLHGVFFVVRFSINLSSLFFACVVHEAKLL